MLDGPHIVVNGQFAVKYVGHDSLLRQVQWAIFRDLRFIGWRHALSSFIEGSAAPRLVNPESD